jgi:hypothetical protein
MQRSTTIHCHRRHPSLLMKQCWPDSTKSVGAMQEALLGPKASSLAALDLMGRSDSCRPVDRSAVQVASEQAVAAV